MEFKRVLVHQKETSRSIPWKQRLFVQIGLFSSLFELIVKEMVVIPSNQIRAIKRQLNEIKLPEKVKNAFKSINQTKSQLGPMKNSIDQ